MTKDKGSAQGMSLTTAMMADYDREMDAMFVRFADGTIVESEEVAPGVVLDFDADGRILAMEVLDATKRLAPGAVPEAAE